MKPIVVKSLLLLSLLLAVLVSENEARGGRRGGSFGGIFGGWRKYKKPASSGGNSRRTTNGSPMHTTATKSVNSGSEVRNTNLPSISSHKNAATQTKTQASYPKQQVPNSYSGLPASGMGTAAGAGYQPPGSYGIPPGGTYYASPAAMPPGAVYYSQPPTSSGLGNFMFGMLAGHVVSNTLFGRPHTTNVYYQATPPNQDKVIIINNGNATSNGTEAVPALPPESANWPINTNETAQPLQPTDQLMPTNNEQHPQPSGIICVPMIFAEPDPNDTNKTVNVEKTVCYPAPPPPPPPSSQENSTECVMRTFAESDPDDPTKTREVQRTYCPQDNNEPKEIAGEIGDGTEGAIKDSTTSSSSPIADPQL